METHVHPRSIGRLFPLAVGLIVAGLLAAFIAIAPSYATSVSVVSKISLAREDKETTAPTVGIHVMTMSFDIDTTGKDVAPGDTFTIQIPPELEIVSDSGSSTLNFSMLNDDKVPVVDCSVPAGEGVSMTCTFGEYAKDHHSIIGHGTVRTKAVHATSSSTVSFPVNGTAIVVDLPGGSISGTYERILRNTQKWGQPKQGDSSRIIWEIDIKGSQLPEGATAVEIVDTFDMSSGGYSLVPGSEKLYYYNNDAEYQAEQAPALKAGASIGDGTFTMEATADGTGFTATFPRLTNNGTYVLQYEATINNVATVRNGVTFHNDALINAKLYTGDPVRDPVSDADHNPDAYAVFHAHPVGDAHAVGDAHSQADAVDHPNSFGYADPVGALDAELVHSPGHAAHSFDSRAEAAGSHGRRHDWCPRWRRHAGPAGRAGGGGSPTRSLTVPPSA